MESATLRAYFLRCILEKVRKTTPPLSKVGDMSPRPPAVVAHESDGLFYLSHVFKTYLKLSLRGGLLVLYIMFCAFPQWDNERISFEYSLL